MFGCLPEMSHGAEAACLTLLKVTAVLGAEFIDWYEDNYHILDTVMLCGICFDCQ